MLHIYKPTIPFDPSVQLFKYNSHSFDRSPGVSNETAEIEKREDFPEQNTDVYVCKTATWFRYNTLFRIAERRETAVRRYTLFCASERASEKERKEYERRFGCRDYSSVSLFWILYLAGTRAHTSKRSVCPREKPEEEETHQACLPTANKRKQSDDARAKETDGEYPARVFTWDVITGIK